VWLGGAVAACAMFGPACAADTSDAGSTNDLNTKRFDAELLFDVSVPVRSRGIVIAPGAGVGLGWQHTVVPFSPGDPLDVDGGGIRGEVRLGLSFPIGHGVHLEIGVAIAFAPLAHTEVRVDEGHVLPGEPNVFARGGFGVRFGGP
jgi:ribosomal protein L27